MFAALMRSRSGRAKLLFTSAIVSLSALGSTQAAEVRDIAGVPKPAAEMAATASALSGSLPAMLGLDAESSFALSASNALPNGAGVAVRLDQLFRGVPVWGQQVVAQVAPDGSITYLGGTAVFDAAANTPAPTPSLDMADAVKAAQAAFAAGGSVAAPYSNLESELVYFLPPDAGADLRLVYRVSFFSELRDASGDVRPTRPVYFIDASSGDVVWQYDNLHTIAAPSLVATGAGSNASASGLSAPSSLDLPAVVTTSQIGIGPGGNTNGTWTWGSGGAPKYWVAQDSAVANTCKMDDTQYIATENMNGGSTTFNAATAVAFSFTCNAGTGYNHTGDGVNGGASPLNDAHALGRLVIDMYRLGYGVTSPLPRKFWMRVHSGHYTNYSTWNGGDYAEFGDSSTLWGGTYPSTELDVIGHWIGSAVIQNTSNLTYSASAMSGAINLAYADMTGEAAEYYVAQTYSQILAHAMPDYLVAADIFATPGDAPTGSLRSMCTPSVDGGSIDDVRDYNTTVPQHYASGPYNKAFCLLAKTSGWDAKKAFNVFRLANQSYWTASETFRGGAAKAVTAAGVLALPTADVKAAFKAVGLDLPFASTNNNFANASVTFGAPQGGGVWATGWESATANNASATKESGEPSLTYNAGGRSVWWKCKASATKSVTVTTNGSNFNTMLGVFTGNAVSSLTKIAEDNDTAGNTLSKAIFSAVAGTTYYFMVDGVSAASGEIVLNVTSNSCEGLPVVACTATVNPTSIANGESAMLTWSSTNGTSASFDNGIGSVGLVGSMSVSPQSTTTYTGTFEGPSGPAICPATLTVNAGGGGGDDPGVTAVDPLSLFGVLGLAGLEFRRRVRRRRQELDRAA